MFTGRGVNVYSYGVGRPVAPSKVIAVRLPVEVYEAWERAAVKAGRSVGEHVKAKLIEAAPKGPAGG